MFKNYSKFDTEFLETIQYFGDFKNELVEKIEALPDKQKLCMKYLYAFMPVSDGLSYDYDLFFAYAEHGIFAYENAPWKDEITEDLFFKDVLCPRINSEKIENCRPVFYEMFADRIRGMNLDEAIIELNYACFEHVTYRSTDIRTISPLNILKRAYGRCGEESTFTASVLRSFCIPAKQVYAPFWSHQDDNHAWVEVFNGENWHYLGACEPEPILDVGWFTTAAGRAMLIHSREFYRGGNSFTTDGAAKIVNHLGRYAKTKKLRITVTDNGRPVSDCLVSFDVVNYASMSTLTTMKTDKTGVCEFETGYGTLFIRAMKNGKFVESITDVDDTEHGICFENAVYNMPDSISDFDCIAPADPNLGQSMNSESSYKFHREKYLESDRKRLAKEAAFTLKHSEQLDPYLKKAKGNGGEIIDYYESNKSNLYVFTLLNQLNEKDLIDSSCRMLTDFLNHFTKFAGKIDDIIFTQYILNPRIMNEELYYYCDYLSENIQFENPIALWEYLENTIKDNEDRGYSQIFTPVQSVLRHRRGCEMSKRMLFVAACRSFGVPARVNGSKGLVEFYENGEFRTIANKKARLILKHNELSYGSNFRISMFSNGSYIPLMEMENTHEIALESGYYRIITSNRTPNGNVFARKYDFFMAENEVKEMEISLRDYEMKDMLFKLKLHEFKVSDGKKIHESTTAFRDSICIWLLTNHEPSEHIINELKENSESIKHIKINLVLKNSAALENASIKALVEAIDPQIYFDENFLNHEMTARKLYLDSATLPLAMSIDKDSFAGYACCGYNVGSVELLAKIYKIIS